MSFTLLPLRRVLGLCTLRLFYLIKRETKVQMLANLGCHAILGGFNFIVYGDVGQGKKVMAVGGLFKCD